MIRDYPGIVKQQTFTVQLENFVVGKAYACLYRCLTVLSRDMIPQSSRGASGWLTEAT